MSDPDAIIRATLDAAQEAAFLLDAGRTVLYANQAARRLFGEAHTGSDFVQIIRHPDCIGAIQEVLTGRQRAERTFQTDTPIRASFNLVVTALQSQPTEEAAEALRVIVSLKDVSELREAEQMRSDFVANVSHELRTPLTALTGFIETLKGPAKDDLEAQARFLELMEEEASRMVRLIADLLSLSKVEARQRQRPDGSVDMVAVVEQVRTTLASQAEQEQKTIHCNFEANLDPIPGSEDELRQAIQNLLENAIKYAGADTAVTIRLYTRDAVAGIRGPALAVEVSDRGEGIAKEHLARLTERFYRVDAHRSRDKGGTGLGLAIVKHIINRHRGRLQIDSTPTEGSTFTLYLPITR